MFEHRLASLLGMTVAKMLRVMSHREMNRWRRYWGEEPWGSYRDNLHAAMIAVELRRPQMRKGAKLSLDTFMLRIPEDRREKALRLFESLRAQAKVVRK